MNYVLFDYYSEISYFTEAVPEPRTVMNLVGEKGPRIKQMVSCCRKCAKKVKPGDTIICWYDFMAVLCRWLCGSKRNKIKIIAVNILLKDKDSFKNKIAKYLYKKALCDDNFIATVTAREYGNYLNRILNINRKYTLIHDAYNGESLKHRFDAEVIPNSVFCGGYNGRDWGMLMDIAERLPEITFNLVIPKAIEEFCNNKIKERSLKNVNLNVAVPRDEFARIMEASEMVVMPLDSEAPSGLLVFYEAAANSKLIITTKTVTTVEYFSNNRGILCSREDINEWTDAIKHYIGNKAEQSEITENLKGFLERECSVGKYQNIIRTISKY